MFKENIAFKQNYEYGYYFTLALKYKADKCLDVFFEMYENNVQERRTYIEACVNIGDKLVLQKLISISLPALIDSQGFLMLDKEFFAKFAPN